MSEIAELFKQSVPDDSLRLWTMGGMTDLSRFARAPIHYGGVVCGYRMHFEGTNDWIDWGDVGNIQLVSMLIDPETTSEEIFQIDTGKNVTVSAGTVTYNGMTPVATYVNGAASTALAADKRQHLVCVFTQDDADNFELGTDGANFGNIDLRNVKAYDRIPSADEVADWYARLKRAV